MKKFFERILAILDFFTPKDKKIIVFGGNEMRGINGNVAAVVKAWPNNPKTKGLNAFTLSTINERFSGLETIDPRSIKGIFTLLRAHTAVVSHVYGDLYWHSLYNGKRRRIINLWHGTPLKRIGPWKGWGKTNALIAASKIERLSLSACLEFPLEKIFVTGFPRTDQLIRGQKKLKKEAIEKLSLRDGGQKWILYIPTYRKSNRLPHYLHRMPDFSYKELENILKKINAYLIVRPHVNDIFSDFENQDRVITVSFTVLPEVEPLYAMADVLITDYSSSIFEYLTFDRPIVGFAPDLEEYRKIPGLLYDYETIFPGPIAKNWKGLKSLIIKAIQEPKKYKTLRESQFKLFHKFKDGNSTKRCIDLICDFSIN
ncbi:MAG TPA: CDP-glycerol glycerophosphotransferase family protein [Candidatus Nanoarchaeia archaeon]